MGKLFVIRPGKPRHGSYAVAMPGSVFGSWPRTWMPRKCVPARAEYLGMVKSVQLCPERVGKADGMCNRCADILCCHQLFVSAHEPILAGATHVHLTTDAFSLGKAGERHGIEYVRSYTFQTPRILLAKVPTVSGVTCGGGSTVPNY